MGELSSLRNTQGFWQPSPRLQAILLCKTAADSDSIPDTSADPPGHTDVTHDAEHSSADSSEAAMDSHAADSSSKGAGLDSRLNISRPKECVDDSVWVTVSVLGFLSMHCASEQQLWSDMQSKAVLWLRSTAWGANNSVAGAVAAARKSLV